MEPYPFLSRSHYLPPCQDTGLTLDSSVNLAQPREDAGGLGQHHPSLLILRVEKKLDYLPAGAWGARGPAVGVLCSMSLCWRARSPAHCQPRPREETEGDEV